MKPIRYVCLLAVAASMLTLTGCFDYTEETKFDETGAGKLSIVFNLGDLSSTEKLAAAILKKNPINKDDMQKDLPEGVKLIEYREESKNEQKTIYATYEFKNLEALKNWQTQKARFATLALTKVGDVWAYSRTIKAKDKDDLENAKKHFSRSKVVLKLTGPGKLVKEESNPMRVENETTCVWEGSLPELMEGKDGNGTVMKAQYDISKPKIGLIIAIGAGVLVLVVIVVVMMGKKKSGAAPTPPAA